MSRQVPFIALWASLVYLIAALAVTSKLCFDQLRGFARGAAQASGPFDATNPAWVIMMADAAQDRLWWMCAAMGLGALLIALSALWVSLSSRGPTVSADAAADGSDSGGKNR
jgi:hypothetical protein